MLRLQNRRFESIASTPFLSELPKGIAHTMCFIGVGNHGGGPTEKQIAWCREHQNAIRGAKLEFEPWLDWDDSYWLGDENGAPVPYQRTYYDSMVFQIRSVFSAKYGFPRLVFPAHLKSGTLGFWHVERGTAPAFTSPEFVTQPDFAAHTLRFGSTSRPFPYLALIEEPTDTWSHNYQDALHQSYAEKVLETAQFKVPQLIDDGPVFRAWVQSGSIGNSRLEAEWRVYAGEAFADLRLRAHWLEKQKLLKLVWPSDGAPLGAMAFLGAVGAPQRWAGVTTARLDEKWRKQHRLPCHFRP